MPRNLRRSRVLRTLTNDSTVDKALKEIYDKLDDLQPEELEKASPLYNKKAPIGSTMLVKNTIGEDYLAIKTKIGWKVDINSNLVSVDSHLKAIKGPKAIKGEALLYDSSSNLTALNNFSIKNIPQVTADTDKFLVSDGGTVKYVTGDTLRTYIDGLRFDGSTANGVLTYKDGDEISVESTLTYDTNTLKLSATADDYVTLTIAANGATTLTTVDSDGVSGDFTVQPNGKVLFKPTDDADGQLTFYNGANISGVYEAEDGSHTRLKMYENGGESNDDYFHIEVGEHGATALKTHDNAAINADLTLQADGDIIHDAAGGIELNADGGVIAFKDDTVQLNHFSAGQFDTNYDASNYTRIATNSSGVCTISTVGGTPTDANLLFRPTGMNIFKAGVGGPYLFETATAGTDAAGHGQIWVKNDSPNNLYFTDDTGQDIPLTNNGKARTWTNTSGGYKTNNNSATVYYFQNYPNYHSWGNADSSPTSITFYDSYSYQWCAPAPGVLTNISVTCRAYDTGLTDPLKFYVYKGQPGNNASSTSLTLIGTTGTITPIAVKQMFLSTDITSSNDFAAGDKLWIMYKKDSTSGNQDLYLAVTISGEYT